MQGEFAAELHEVLLKVAAAPPSKYMSVSGQLGMLLQLPISAKRWLEGADDFRDAAAEVRQSLGLTLLQTGSAASFSALLGSHRVIGLVLRCMLEISATHG